MSRHRAECEHKRRESILPLRQTVTEQLCTFAPRVHPRCFECAHPLVRPLTEAAKIGSARFLRALLPYRPHWHFLADCQDSDQLPVWFDVSSRRVPPCMGTILARGHNGLTRNRNRCSLTAPRAVRACNRISSKGIFGR